MKNYKIYKVTKVVICKENSKTYLKTNLSTIDDKTQLWVTYNGEKREAPMGRISLIKLLLDENPELKNRNLLLLCMAISPKLKNEVDDNYIILNVPIRDNDGNYIFIEVPKKYYHDNISTSWLDKTCTFREVGDDLECINHYEIRLSSESGIHRFDCSE